LQRRQPVYAVVSVIGSTEESAVDPLVDLLAVRDRFRARGWTSLSTLTPPGVDI
jgi:hypothetical protein